MEIITVNEMEILDHLSMKSHELYRRIEKLRRGSYEMENKQDDTETPKAVLKAMRDKFSRNAGEIQSIIEILDGLNRNLI